MKGPSHGNSYHLPNFLICQISLNIAVTFETNICFWNQAIFRISLKGLWTLRFLPSKWDYWEIGQLNNFFLFVKDIRNVYIFAWESKNVHAVFKCVLWFSVISLNCFHTFHQSFPKCLFHMNNHKDPAGWVISVERSSRWTEPWGNVNKKCTTFFLLFLGKGFPILDNFYKILGWNKWAVFPVVPFTQ